MGSQGPAPKRPFCERCSKPSRLCLCVRINLPQPLDNPIAVTILQHSLETKHPLNSTRVAKIGLRNLSVVPVTDVNFHAQLLIRPQIAISDDSSRVDTEVAMDNGCVSAEFNKYSVSYSPRDIRITVERSAKPDIGWVLDSPIGQAAATNGFVVSKLQTKKMQPSGEFIDLEEFNVTMPPGSALLFPSSKSIRLEEVDFEVTNLVVLDGTWAKATRIYHENPWLQLLPHVKLHPVKESLYSEVRHQPKAGCLSTIESIVCALKGLGGEMEGLDKLLEVFELMIQDQRCCKDDKFRGLSPLSW